MDHIDYQDGRIRDTVDIIGSYVNPKARMSPLRDKGQSRLSLDADHWNSSRSISGPSESARAEASW